MARGIEVSLDIEPDEEEVERQRRLRLLSAWLRHKPELGGIDLSADGWATFDSVQEAYRSKQIEVTELEIKGYATRDPKRFELDGKRIRARYGHSFELTEGLHPGVPPAELFVGVEPRYLERVLQRGLYPPKRQHVYLSLTKTDARTQAARRGLSGVALHVDAHKAHQAGIKFFSRGNGIWVSEPIPAAFLSQVAGQPDPRQYNAATRSKTGEEIKRKSRRVGIIKRPHLPQDR